MSNSTTKRATVCLSDIESNNDSPSDLSIAIIKQFARSYTTCSIEGKSSIDMIVN